MKRSKTNRIKKTKKQQELSLVHLAFESILKRSAAGLPTSSADVMNDHLMKPAQAQREMSFAKYYLMQFEKDKVPFMNGISVKSIEGVRSMKLLMLVPAELVKTQLNTSEMHKLSKSYAAARSAASAARTAAKEKIAEVEAMSKQSYHGDQDKKINILSDDPTKDISVRGTFCFVNVIQDCMSFNDQGRLTKISINGTLADFVPSDQLAASKDPEATK
jgi:hypothetical protein